MTIEKSVEQIAGETEGTMPGRAGQGRPNVGSTRKITVTRNGPYLVEGAIPLANQTIESDAEGGSREWLQGQPFEADEVY